MCCIIVLCTCFKLHIFVFLQNLEINCLSKKNLPRNLPKNAPNIAATFSGRLQQRGDAADDAAIPGDDAAHAAGVHGG